MTELPPVDVTSHSYVSQRLRLHYLDWGNAGAPPLILVHGGLDHCRNWDWVAAELRGDFHVIAPDLRGHGDSEWASDGQYSAHGFVYDLAQLIEQQRLSPVTLIGHSLGGSICLRYAGLYPQNVAKLVAIEGLGFRSASVIQPVDVRLRAWIDAQRDLAARQPKRYPAIADAVDRMRDANRHLGAEQARHLAVHGVRRNEDGTYSWKFDNYLHSPRPADEDVELPHLWERITCPVMLAYGKNSWASNPAEDGRIAHFQQGQVVAFDDAGHWLHHDQLDRFLVEIRKFLAAG